MEHPAQESIQETAMTTATIDPPERVRDRTLEFGGAHR
jgi:hypothetical protein